MIPNNIEDIQYCTPIHKLGKVNFAYIFFIQVRLDVHEADARHTLHHDFLSG